MAKKKVLSTILVIVLLLFLCILLPVEARRVQDVQSSVANIIQITEFWKVSDVTQQLEEIYERVGEENSNSYIVSQLEKLEQKPILSNDDVGFLVFALKNEANLLNSTSKRFITDAILPVDTFPNDKMGGVLIQHLLWFYNYRISCSDEGLGYGVLGYEVKELEEHSVFHGCCLGLLIDAIEDNGRFTGVYNVAEVTGQFGRAVYWSRPESRVDGTFVSDDELPTLELDSLNKLMSSQSQSMPNKFAPVVLAFKTSILHESYDCNRLTSYPEISVSGGISLNDLTVESKKILVSALAITESKPWMDEEWVQIIEGLLTETP
ncbi:MAG: hypothetical protein P9M06_03850 [Candidatus Saelkia tenebricola]|nr:hypothetical protein [Candidatus Saelkia tenebricola]